MRILWLALAVALPVAFSRPAGAHDVWADGTAVPPWVKAMCCGPEDVHKDAVIDRIKGQVFVRGLIYPVDQEKIFDSHDGHVWAFYNPNYGSSAIVYCLFIVPST
jgi:hypothetical protein